MRILHVITGLGTGGAETALCRLLESLRPPDFVHSVIALGREAALSARVRKANVSLTHLNMNSAGIPWPLWSLRRLVRASRADLVHAWMYHANLVATVATCGGSKPMLWSIRHCIYDMSQEKSTTRWVIRAGAKLSYKPQIVLYNSIISAGQHEAFGYRADKTKVIVNGFDTREFRPDSERRARVRSELGLAPSDVAIGLIARLHPIKDHDNFLKAAALCAVRISNAVFVLVGEGVTEGNQELVDKAHSLGLSGRIRFCGQRSDVAAINAALDIACSSSWSEAFPNSIGEAMACGVPCVATDVGDVREIIGTSGIVVPPRDPEKLCAAWLSLNNIGITGRCALGEKARQRIVRHYSLSAVVQEYADVYKGTNH